MVLLNPLFPYHSCFSLWRGDLRSVAAEKAVGLAVARLMKGATNESARKDLDKKMLITKRSVISNIFTHMVVKKNGTKFRSSIVVSQKRELGEKSRDKQESIFSLRVSNTILAQSAVTVLGLGFIDAG
ncbi:hypothetical protein ACSBR2_021244 [Camellia fascicularis]